jgi:hypothetical protein
MAECVSGEVTVLVMDAHESKVLLDALLHLYEDDDKYLIVTSDGNRAVLLGLMDAIGAV